MRKRGRFDMEPKEKKRIQQKILEKTLREQEEEERKDTRQFYDRGDFWMLVGAIILFFLAFGRGCVFII
jgi:hypothetical protein